MHWNSIALGFLFGAWFIYWVLGLVHSLPGTKHVFAYGFVAIASALLSKLLIVGGH